MIVRLLTLALLTLWSLPAFAEERWIVYYSDKLPAEKFSGYDVLAFDAEHHPDIAALTDAGKTVLGYISLGEAESYRPDFKELKSKGYLLNENKQWPGHFVIDVRNPEWVKYVIEEQIPQLLFKRFSGLMIDTLDSPLYLEELDAKKYAGMRDAVIRLLAAIRMHYPQIRIMVNRGFEAFPDAAPSVDMILAENIYTDYDFKKKKNHKADPKQFEEYLSMLDSARAANPKLKVYGVEYWDMKDQAGVASIYQTLRSHGIVPYVGDVALDTLHPEPEPKE